MKNFKNKRGFSLVELMVVVAIMGVLAAIAIPAYNEYRKSAKKTAYKSDLISLHKGWLAFGVELDSFCERETTPATASISNVGMASLLSSKLYGLNGNLWQCQRNTATVPCSGMGDAEGSLHQHAVSTCMTGCSAVQIAINRSGPGKHNFIGFNDASNCTNVADDSVRILGAEGTTPTVVPSSACVLNISSYDMGVYGHISGVDYFGVSINQNGVVSNEHEGATGANADAEC